MSCATCGDKGILRIWGDSAELALCLCPAAQWFRSDKNAGKHTGYCGWQVWCAQHQVDPSLVYLLEDVMTADELQARGLALPAAEDREAALLAAGKGKRGKL